MSKNKIILFSNLKGGTGKTTLCELFATYCVEKELPITVMDADPQLSLWKDRRDDMESLPESEIPWEVTPLIVNEEILEVVEKIRKNTWRCVGGLSRKFGESISAGIV